MAPKEKEWWGDVYMLAEDGLRQVFRLDLLLELEVRQWCGDIEHE